MQVRITNLWECSDKGISYPKSLTKTTGWTRETQIHSFHFTQKKKKKSVTQQDINPRERLYSVSHSLPQLDWKLTDRRGWILVLVLVVSSLVARMIKNPPAMQETWVRSLDWDYPLEKEIATSSIILAWRIPWTEEPGRLVHGVTESDTAELLTLSLSVSLRVPGTRMNPSFHLMRQLGFLLGHSSVSGTSPLLKPHCRRAAYGLKFPTWNSNQELSASSCPPPSKKKLLKLHFWYTE